MSVEEYKDIATKLFKEEFVSIQPEEYTQFLASNDEESTIIRGYYMDLFKWDPNLLKATRNLCSKLYLKGESQEIDRILTSFTKSYIKQNPVNVFCTKNFEKIYIVLYSLILLNTSLHNSEINKKSKISQGDYIKNTFTTFIQQDPKALKKLSIKQRITIERELGSYYDDLLKQELHLKTNMDEGDKLNHITPVSVGGGDDHEHDASRDSKLHSRSNSSLGYGHDHHNLGLSEDPHTPQKRESVHDRHKSITSNDDLNLSRQVSSSSVWSADTTNRNSLSMKRMPSGTSSVSQFTVSPNHHLRLNNRVGFTRALVSDQMNQRFYNQGNSSVVTNGTYGTYNTVRNRQSIDRLRNMQLQQAQQPSQQQSPSVNRRSSKASIMSRDSFATNHDDAMSVVSYDSGNLADIPFDENQSQQVLENFNVNEFQDKFDLILELQGSPYLKEGILKLKILNNDQQDNNLPDMSASSGASTVSTSSSSASRFFSFFSRSANNSRNPQGQETNSLNPNTANVLNNKFIEYFVVVSKGELSLYSFDPKVIKKHKEKLRKIKQKQQKQLINHFDLGGDDDDEVNETSEDLGDGNWLKNAANVGNYNLCSTFAQLEKASNYTKKTSGYVFSLTFPKVSKKPNKQFIFEAGTKEIALEFINSCNFWSSKITAIPTFEESVSSIEYGWTNLDALISQKANFKRLRNIQKWELLPQGVYLTNYNYNDSQETHYNMMKQFIKTLNYYNNLKKHFKEFNELRLKFIKSFSHMSNTSNYTKIINNYDSKLLDYKFELKKYKNYLIILGFALQLRFDLEDEEKMRNAEYEKNDDVSNSNSAKTAPTGEGNETANGEANEAAEDVNGKTYETNGEANGDATGDTTVTSETTNAEDDDKNDTTIFSTTKEKKYQYSPDLEDQGDDDDDGETELSRLVKYEIRKLFIGLKDVGKIIPTFQTSKSISNLNELQSQIPNLTVNDFNNSFALVKSPKTFTLSNYNDNESPINQLLQSQRNQGVGHTFSTNTIKEEEEPEQTYAY